MVWDGGVKLIVGLGNPGDEYRLTPHNLGFMVVDRIASERGVEIGNRQCRALTARIQVGDEAVLLAKPETYMNLSGVPVRELVAEYEVKPEADLIVIQDELDFPLGTLRIHTRRSSAGHNGIGVDHWCAGHAGFLAHQNRRGPGTQGRRRRTLFAGAVSQS